VREGQKTNHELELAALWTWLTPCYINYDYLELCQPGMIQSLLDGRFGPLGPVTPATLLGAAALLAMSALMVARYTQLPPRMSRPANAVLGLGYSVVMLAVLPGSWHFYKVFFVIEIGISLSREMRSRAQPPRARLR
jgi:hypothetical protein